MSDMTLGGIAQSGDRSVRALCVIWILAASLIVVAVYSLGQGASGTSARTVLWNWVQGREVALRDRVVIFDIRLPRMVLGVVIGAALAVSGAIMQGLFRNPLADPGLVGVGAGAGLGAVSAIVLGGMLPPTIAAVAGQYTVPLAAFFGGWISTLVLYRLATRGGVTSVATMLLGGIVLGALAGAVTGILVYLADDRQLRDLTFWGLGSLAGSNWIKVMAAAPIIALALLASPFIARALNGLALGEAAAAHLGIPVQRMKNCAILMVAAATGAAVAASGGIGFVGFVVPHLLRLSIGPDHRFLLPASALLGGILLLLADMIARSIMPPAELPIGIVTAILGAPVFLWILLNRRSLVEL